MHTRNPHLAALGKLGILLFLLTSCQAPTKLLSLEKQDLPFISKTIISGHQVQVSPLVEGTMNLYFRMIPISEANQYNPYFPYNEPTEVPQFFIGTTHLMRIDEWNYESVLKQLMTDRPILVKKLGRQGFRFENIRQMVYYYNQQEQEKLALMEQ